MKQHHDSWKDYWDARGKNVREDYEVDRGQTCRGTEADELAERHLLAFIDPKAEERILDAGCGTGINIERLSRKVRSLVGIDYSESMVERARKRMEAEHVTNAEVRAGSIAATGLPSDSFDKIICISVMQYLRDQDAEAALKEFVRITKNGSEIILHVKNLASLYLGSLYAAKKLKSLISKNVKIEFYRAQRWYERKLSQFGAKPVQYDSRSIFVVDFLPRGVYNWLLLMEARHYKSRFLRRYGSEYFIKARVEKTNLGPKIRLT
jgi:ubiquinone/menaquinone biosynthesis C-methylase UbiE